MSAATVLIINAIHVCLDVCMYSTGILESFTLSKRLGKRALLKRNANENMDNVPKSSGTMHGLTHKAKERTPFRTAHVPGQRMREYSNVSVIDGKVKQRGLGRFRQT